MKEIKAEHTTHNIANKGFSGNRRFVARFDFCNGRQDVARNRHWPYCKMLGKKQRKRTNININI